MGKNSKQSLVKPGSSEERGDHPAALMIAEGFDPESYAALIFCYFWVKPKVKEKNIAKDLIYKALLCFYSISIINKLKVSCLWNTHKFMRL